MTDPQRPATNLTPELAAALGARRATVLRRIVRQCNLPPETILDVALGMLDTASKQLLLSPVSRQAVGLGAARWRNVAPEARSILMRRAVNVRWAKRHKVDVADGADTPCEPC